MDNDLKKRINYETVLISTIDDFLRIIGIAATEYNTPVDYKFDEEDLEKRHKYLFATFYNGVINIGEGTYRYGLDEYIDILSVDEFIEKYYKKDTNIPEETINNINETKLKEFYNRGWDDAMKLNDEIKKIIT